MRRWIVGVAALDAVIVAGLLLVPAVAGDDATAASSDDSPTTVSVSTTPTVAPDAVATEVAGAVEHANPQPSPTTGAGLTPPPNERDPIPETIASVALDPPAYPEPWAATVNEVQPDAKELGALVASTITNYDTDATLDSVLGALPVVAGEFAAQVEHEAAIVHHAGAWSRGTVEYAQLGGHLDGRISIMVVIRQELGVEGEATPSRTETRTMDVRLAVDASGAWAFETLASAGGTPIERPADLGSLASAVVDDPRIDLPDSAIWDVYSGHTDEPLLQLMLELADQTPYAVNVLHTGHPDHVFGTPRLSNHTVGRAVDIYAVDGELVVDSHDVSSHLYEVSEWVVGRTDIREFGSPWKFPDAVAHTFTNHVHHDHIHIGVFEQP